MLKDGSPIPGYLIREKNIMVLRAWLLGWFEAHGVHPVADLKLSSTDPDRLDVDRQFGYFGFSDGSNIVAAFNFTGGRMVLPSAAELEELSAPKPAPEPTPAPAPEKKERETCDRCAGTGQFITRVENGKPTGPGGICFRCEGKGYQTEADKRRNWGYDMNRKVY